MYLSLYNNSPVYGYIYKIIFPNGKCYIGLTVDLVKRWKQHRQNAKAGNTRYLYNALRKYNMVDTFIMIIIDTAKTAEELCEKEIAHIEIHNSYYINEHGYNMTYGGESTNGYEFTEEDREKMSDSQKKRFENPEERKKSSEAHKKTYENQEARQKNKEAQINFHKNNPEARQKMSEIKKQYYKDNPEAAILHGKKIKRFYENNPQERQKNGERQRKRFENLEEREKMRKIKKRYYENNSEARQYKKNYKPFNVFKIDGTYIKSFDYQYQAREYLQKTYGIKGQIKISEVLRGTRNYSHGFTFKYKE